MKNLKNAESDNVLIEFKAVLLLLLDLLEHGETDRAIQRIKKSSKNKRSTETAADN